MKIKRKIISLSKSYRNRFKNDYIEEHNSCFMDSINIKHKICEYLIYNVKYVNIKYYCIALTKPNAF